MDISRLSNVEISALALWSLGGATTPQHTEDVAAKCFELAPSRFSWRRYPQYPNLETAAAALRDSKKKNREKIRALTSGNNRIGWLLTESGVEWAQNAQQVLPAAERISTSSALHREDASDLNSLRSHRTFKAWQTQTDEIQVYEIADAVRLTSDAPREIVRQRIEEMSNKAQLAGFSDIKEYLTWLRANVTKAQ